MKQDHTCTSRFGSFQFRGVPTADEFQGKEESEVTLL